MSNETKRGVFLQLAKENRDLRMYDPETIEPKELIEQDYQDWIREYDASLPDNLPVIPQAVGEYIQWGKSYDIQLYMMYVSQLINRPGFKKLTDDAKSWIISSSNAFARAWVLGVWSVEETGKIVKLEAQHE
jgi:hypothetical protein